VRRILLGGLLFLMGILVVLPTLLSSIGTKAAAPEPEPQGVDSLTISVYFPDTKETRDLVLGEYLKGVVAAEMPEEFGDEALKAQFVVARTYAVHRMAAFRKPGKVGCPLEPKADICADPRTGQDYMSLAEAKQRSGEAVALSYWKRLDGFQQETQGLVLRYRGELIDPLYHAVSGTATEAAGDYFNEQVEYLQSVDDSWGAEAKNLKVTETRTLEEVAAKLSNQGQPLAVPALANSVKAGKIPIQIVEKTPTGRVKTVRVGNLTLTGRDVRERLGLRSTNFQVSVQQGKVVFQTTGYGHGVGMSQWGANGMARAGKTFRDILAHYYRGVSLAPLFG